MVLACCGAASSPAGACTARATESARPAARTASRPSKTGGVPEQEQRRREAVVALERQGVHLDWRLASWSDLHDWTQRTDEARLLREYYGVVVDWRAHGLRELKEWEARAARAASLRRLGVEVDWRLFTAAQMDALEGYLERVRPSATGTPLTVSENAVDRVTLSFDPDGTLLPAFVTEELSRVDTDDTVLEPSFADRSFADRKNGQHSLRTRRVRRHKRSGGRGHAIAAAVNSAAPKHDRGARASGGSLPDSRPGASSPDPR